MNNSITQNNPFYSKTYSIEDTGLVLQKKSKNSDTELHFSFEQIKTDRITEVDHNIGLLIGASVIGAIGLLIFFIDFSEGNDLSATPIWLGISTALFICYISTKKKKLYLQLTDAKPIEFFANKDSIEDVRNFLDLLIVHRNSYLVSKYGNVNKYLEYPAQFENLNWLLNMRAISKKIYDEKVEQLNNTFNNHSSNKPIGFSYRE